MKTPRDSDGHPQPFVRTALSVVNPLPAGTSAKAPATGADTPAGAFCMQTIDPDRTPVEIAPETIRNRWKVKVRAYGKLAELLGQESNVDIDVPCTVGELRTYLAATNPEAAGPLTNKRVLACVGDTVVPDDHILRGGEPVELLAPVSGG